MQRRLLSRGNRDDIVIINMAGINIFYTILTYNLYCIFTCFRIFINFFKHPHPHFSDVEVNFYADAPWVRLFYTSLILCARTGGRCYIQLFVLIKSDSLFWHISRQDFIKIHKIRQFVLAYLDWISQKPATSIKK